MATTTTNITSTPTPSPPKCQKLVLDAGPLLALTPLRGLAQTFYTVPQVLVELRDSRARDHFERLGLISGVNVEIRSPDAASLAHVIQWSKKSGDYSVLSQPDLCVLALTYMLEQEALKEEAAAAKTAAAAAAAEALPSSSSSLEKVPAEGDGNSPLPTLTEAEAEAEAEMPIEESLAALSVQEPSELAKPTTNSEEKDDDDSPSTTQTQDQPKDESSPQVAPEPESNTADTISPPPLPLFADPSDNDDDDGEGEWITPDNVALHKSRFLDLLPSDLEDKHRKAKKQSRRRQEEREREHVRVGCMTADFAMQNVLLQMGLALVGVEGKRIEKVKTWVLRCHACFKLCKDASKKFCPSCGNPTLIRASVTLSSPTASASAPTMQIHLKQNFQYRLRGTKYPIPAPKPGSSKTGPGEGLILREDQSEYMRAKQRADRKREREEVRLTRGILDRGAEGDYGSMRGSWTDPDWMPSILATGASGKGRDVRSANMDGDMPKIGFGKRNPNERRRKR